MTLDDLLSQIGSLKEKSNKLWNAREYEQSIGIDIQCCTLLKQKFGEKNLEYVQSLKTIAEKQSSLALAYDKNSDFTKAEPLYLQALDNWHITVGKEHIEYASRLNNLGFLYFRTGRYSEAEHTWKQALDIWRKIVGEEDVEFFTTLGNLSWLYIQTGKYDDAEPLCKQALEISRKLFSEDDSRVERCFNNLVHLYTTAGKYSELNSFLSQNTKNTNRKSK